MAVGLVCFLLFYVGLRAYIHSDLKQRVNNSYLAAQDTVVTPVIASINTWRYTVKTDAGYHCGYIYYYPAQVAEDLFIENWTGHNDVLDVVNNTGTYKAVSYISRHVAYHISKFDGGYHIEIFDPRYAFPGRALFKGHVRLNERLEVIEEYISNY